MSILFVINSCTAPFLFLKEFTFSAPIVTFSAFCNLCAVTDGKTSFPVFSSAELFLLSDLILSSVGLAGLSVWAIYIKTKFLFTLFAIADSSFSVLFLPPMQVSSRQAFILKQKLLTRRVVPYSFQWIPLLFHITKLMFLLSTNGNCLIPHFFFNNWFTSLSFLFNLSFLITKPEMKTLLLLVLIEAAKFNI